MEIGENLRVPHHPSWDKGGWVCYRVVLEQATTLGLYGPSTKDRAQEIVEVKFSICLQTSKCLTRFSSKEMGKIGCNLVIEGKDVVFPKKLAIC